MKKTMLGLFALGALGICSGFSVDAKGAETLPTGYYNIYGCQDQRFGFKFYVIQTSRYGGLNAHDKDQSTVVLLENLGKIQVDMIKVEGGDFSLQRGTKLVLTANGDQEDVTVGMELILQAKKKKSSPQVAHDLKGSLSLHFQKHDGISVQLTSDDVVCHKA